MASLRRGAALSALAVAVTLTAAGCSGSGPAHPAATGAPTQAGPCDKASFSAHAGVAAGAIRRDVWGPYTSGAFAAGAKDRRSAMSKASRAGALAASELSAAQAGVRGCQSATRLVNALTTGISLSRSISHQLASGTVTVQALGGANSAISTVLSEARRIGLGASAQAGGVPVG